MLPNKPSSSSSPSRNATANVKKVMFPDKIPTAKQMRSTTLTNTAGLSSLVTFTVLLLAWISGFASRLFAVIRFESIIHEFDPWYVPPPARRLSNRTHRPIPPSDRFRPGRRDRSRLCVKMVRIGYVARFALS